MVKLMIHMGEGTLRNRLLKSVCVLLNTVLGLVSGKLRNLFGFEKPFVKLRPSYSVNLVFSYVVILGNKN